MIRFGLLFFFTLTVFQANAKIELIEWRPTPAGATLILPKRSGETASAAIRNYVREFNKHPELVEINEGKLAALIGDVSEFTDDVANDDPTMLVSANDPFRMRGPRNQKNWFRMLEKSGARVYVLPTVAGIALKGKELNEFNRLIARSFDGLLLLGGADIDPSLYGQKNRSAKRNVLIRDQYEHAIAQAFLRADHGLAFGICRGMQMLAIALGCEMYQDIKTELPDVDTDHTWDDHEMFFEPGKRNFLAQAFGFPKSITINSVHHQAVRCENVDENLLKVLARDDYGIVEAFEIKGGKGFAVQFHPERLEKGVGKKVFALMGKMIREQRNERTSCNRKLTGS